MSISNLKTNDVPTRVNSNVSGITSSSCIDHINANASQLCSEAVSVLGFRDHNGYGKESKRTKAESRVTMQRSYKSFCEEIIDDDDSKFKMG